MKPPITVVGIPMDLGQARRGVDMGPSALRYAGLNSRLRGLGYEVEDRGNISIAERSTLPPEGGMSFLDAVVRACEHMYEAGREAVAQGRLPLFVGGDHSISAGTIGGVTHDGPCGVLWVDAHGDFNTPETTPSGNIHGMPLAALCGFGASDLVNVGRPGPKLRPQDVVAIGVRDLDGAEKALLKKSGIAIYTMRDIDDRGVADVAREALDRLTHLPRVHVSLDMDCMDPREAPGVGTPVTGGLTYREAHLLMELIADEAVVGSIDVVEINPILDLRNRTAEIALELVASALGKSIL
ncbi:MAG TPA: arginase [Kofleriaceae bacterium]|jgi:arginase